MEPIDPLQLLRERLARLRGQKVQPAKLPATSLPEPPAPVSGPAARQDGRGFHPGFEGGLNRMLAEAPGKARIGSGFRTYQEQSEFYRAHKEGRGNPANPPGTSEHEFGRAADLESDPETLRWMRENAEQYGLRFPYEKEPWHVEAIDQARTEARQDAVIDPQVAIRRRVFGVEPQDQLKQRLAAIRRKALAGGDGAPGAPGDTTGAMPAPAGPDQWDQAEAAGQYKPTVPVGGPMGGPLRALQAIAGQIGLDQERGVPVGARLQAFSSNIDKAFLSGLSSTV
jgi:hypothetical protein